MAYCAQARQSTPLCCSGPTHAVSCASCHRRARHGRHTNTLLGTQPAFGLTHQRCSPSAGCVRPSARQAGPTRRRTSSAAPHTRKSAESNAHRCSVPSKRSSSAQCGNSVELFQRRHVARVGARESFRTAPGHSARRTSHSAAAQRADPPARRSCLLDRRGRGSAAQSCMCARAPRAGSGRRSLGSLGEDCIRCGSVIPRVIPRGIPCDTRSGKASHGIV